MCHATSSFIAIFALNVISGTWCMKQSMIFGDDKLRLGVGGGSAVGHLIGNRSVCSQHGKCHCLWCKQWLRPICHQLTAKGPDAWKPWQVWMLTPSGWAGEGFAVDHLLGTGAEPRQEAPLLVPQAVIIADDCIDCSQWIWCMVLSTTFCDNKLRVGVGSGSAVGQPVGSGSEQCQRGARTVNKAWKKTWL